MSENASRYLSATEITSQYSISASCLRNWANNDKIKVTRTQGGKRFYNISDVRKCLGRSDNKQTGSTIAYTRVSSQHQKQDLQRQIEYIKEKYQYEEVISDIGSGLNYNRKGLQKLLSKVESGDVKEVVVTYKDRLCRYGIELIERIFRTYNTTLVVLCDEVGSEESELGTDLLDICNFFVAKRNERKSAKFRNERKSMSTETSPLSEDTSLSFEY